MQNILDYLKNIFGSQSWISEVSAILILAFLLGTIVAHLLKHAEKITKFTNNFWDDAIIDALKKPLSFFIYLNAIDLSLEVIANNFQSNLYPHLFPINYLIATFAISWFLLRLVNFTVKEFALSAKFVNDEFNRTSIDAIAKVSKLIIIVLTLLTILQIFGFSISGILAAGGAGGLVIGFAAKDLFANVFGGLTIYLDRPFNVGDWIRCASQNIEGNVEHIGWRQTVIRAFNRNPIYVPNAIFTNAVVENPSRMTHRRLKEIVGIRYDDIDKLPAITDEVRQMIFDRSEIDSAEDVIVSFEVFNSSSVDFWISAFTKITTLPEFRKLKQEIMLDVAKIIAKHGAEIAFPTRVIHMKN